MKRIKKIKDISSPITNDIHLLIAKINELTDVVNEISGNVPELISALENSERQLLNASDETPRNESAHHYQLAAKAARVVINKVKFSNSFNP